MFGFLKKMFIFRLNRRRIIILFCCAIFLLILNLIFRRTENSVSDCNVPNEVHDLIWDLISKLTSALDAAQLSYFLCYSTLWGALKIEGPYLWQKNIDFCILNKEVSQIDELFLVNIFKRYGLSIHYNNANGIYNVKILGRDEPSGTLTVFEEDSVTHQMRRVGWTHRLYPPFACDQLHCFPKDLITPPLSKTVYGAYKLPVPHEGIEIQKYLYPNSWWKEENPDCA